MSYASRCLTKRVYASLDQAQADAAWLRRVKRRPVHPYRCWLCGKWHLGRRGWRGEKRAA